MKLKGITKDGQAVKFSIEDCPIFVSDDEIALTKRKKSKLLRADTIMRGDDKGVLFEGDILNDGVKNIGYVVYQKGFKMWNSADGVKPFPEMQHIKVVEGTIESCNIVQKIQGRTPVLLSYRDKIKQFNSFVHTKKGKIMLTGLSTAVNPSDIKFYTGLTDDKGKELFFGDIHDGGTITLYDYQLALKVGDSYVPIEIHKGGKIL